MLVRREQPLLFSNPLMQTLPLTELPQPLFLVISEGRLRAHTTDPTSPWHTLLEAHLDQPWTSALEAAFSGSSAADSIEKAIEENLDKGRFTAQLQCDEPWLQILAQWHTDSVSSQTYLNLSAELVPLASSRAHNEAVEAVPKEALMVRLKQAESKLETYLHHFPGVLFSQRPDGSCAFVSPRMSNWIGDQAQRMTRSSGTFHSLIAPDDREKTLQTIRENSPKGKPYSLQYRMLHPETQALIYVYDIRLPIVLGNGTHLQDEGIWIDVTRQAVAENRISASLWKENLSAITSGLVHDFSNSMAGIFSLSELYHDEMDPSHPRHEGMGQIKSHAMRAQRLVSRIVDMNREIAGYTSYHNLEVLIRDLEDIIRIILPKSVELQFEFPDDELLVSVDEVAFRQTFTHFVTNFRDAQPAGGQFGVKVEKTDAGFKVHIWDNGPGIDPEIAPRVFDPFFSTKEATEAAGFGLYAAKTFVEAAGGELTLGSETYPGAHFILFLPNADTSRKQSDGDYLAIEESAATSYHSVAMTAKKSCLVIIGEDAAAVDFLSSGLSQNPWDIRVFSNSHDAARELEERDQTPGVILFASGSGESTKASQMTPLEQWSDEAMSVLFSMPGAERPNAETIEIFDMLLDDSLGIEDIQDRLTPWMG